MKTIITAATLALATLSAPAMAKTVTVSVDVERLDLSNEADVEVVKARLRVAVARACEPEAIELLATSAARECRAEAMREGLAQLNAMRKDALDSAPRQVALRD